jgi:hypothetical protein
MVCHWSEKKINNNLPPGSLPDSQLISGYQRGCPGLIDSSIPSSRNQEPQASIFNNSRNIFEGKL